jgi:UV DNA damage endonuclease
LEYHAELLSLLNMPEQLDRDAVMILHLGGVFGDKEATLQRFKENYLKLSDEVKKRLVLENDDVSWSVHDLLPVCEELNIPMVLDFHHHNIIFDSTQLREGTKDIMDLYPRIRATWTKKGITQKMHYSEPCPEAITGRERRKHNPRPFTLPPCADDMDLMIEAKDKEQAVFELMRTFRLPGWDTFNNIVPYQRDDDNKPEPRKPAKKAKKKTKKQLQAEAEDPSLVEEEPEADVPKKEVIPEEEVGMGGKFNRVYWPPGMEEWLRPKKREVKKKTGGADDVDPVTGQTDAQALANPTPMNLKQRQAAKAKKAAAAADAGTTTDEGTDMGTDAGTDATEASKTVRPKKAPAKRKPAAKAKAPIEDEEEDELTPVEEDEDDASSLDLGSDSDEPAPKKAKTNGAKAAPVRRTGRKAAVKKTGKGYKEASSGSEMDVD